MATREAVYQAAGKALELAQLLETEIGTSLLALDALETKSFLRPDADAYTRLRDAIDGQTLGRSLKQIKSRLNLDDNLEDVFADALESRNFLAHRFYAQHGTRIFEPAGCDHMIAHIDKLREKLMRAYNSAQGISELLTNAVHLLAKQGTKRDP
jgi:hypothetical protein